MTAPVFVPSVVPCQECEEQVVAHLDEDWAVPCERKGSGCEGQNPAAWIAFFEPCCRDKPTHALWCTPCVKRMLDSSLLQCKRCFAYKNHPRIEPLNRRTT